jgi:hypothetical protein
MTNGEIRQAEGSRNINPCRACGRVPDGIDVRKGRRFLCGECFDIYSRDLGGKEVICKMVADRKAARARENSKADAGNTRKSSESQRAAWRSRLRARMADMDRASPAKVSEVIRDLWGDPDCALVLTAEPLHYIDEFALTRER